MIFISKCLHLKTTINPFDLLGSLSLLLCLVCFQTPSLFSVIFHYLLLPFYSCLGCGFIVIAVVFTLSISRSYPSLYWRLSSSVVACFPSLRRSFRPFRRSQQPSTVNQLSIVGFSVFRRVKALAPGRSMLGALRATVALPSPTSPNDTERCFIVLVEVLVALCGAVVPGRKKVNESYADRVPTADRRRRDAAAEGKIRGGNSVGPAYAERARATPAYGCRSSSFVW